MSGSVTAASLVAAAVEAAIRAQAPRRTVAAVAAATAAALLSHKVVAEVVSVAGGAKAVKSSRSADADLDAMADELREARRARRNKKRRERKKKHAQKARDGETEVVIGTAANDGTVAERQSTNEGDVPVTPERCAPRTLQFDDGVLAPTPRPPGLGTGEGVEYVLEEMILNEAADEGRPAAEILEEMAREMANEGGNPNYDAVWSQLPDGSPLRRLLPQSKRASSVTPTL